jgi:hypothetical protein
MRAKSRKAAPRLMEQSLAASNKCLYGKKTMSTYDELSKKITSLLEITISSQEKPYFRGLALPSDSPPRFVAEQEQQAVLFARYNRTLPYWKASLLAELGQPAPSVEQGDLARILKAWETEDEAEDPQQRKRPDYEQALQLRANNAPPKIVDQSKIMALLDGTAMNGTARALLRVALLSAIENDLLTSADVTDLVRMPALLVTLGEKAGTAFDWQRRATLLKLAKQNNFPPAIVPSRIFKDESLSPTLPPTLTGLAAAGFGTTSLLCLAQGDLVTAFAAAALTLTGAAFALDNTIRSNPQKQRTLRGSMTTLQRQAYREGLLALFHAATVPVCAATAILASFKGAFVTAAACVVLGATSVLPFVGHCLWGHKVENELRRRRSIPAP